MVPACGGFDFHDGVRAVELRVQIEGCRCLVGPCQFPVKSRKGRFIQEIDIRQEQEKVRRGVIGKAA